MLNKDLSVYTFVRWGKKFHILDDACDLCCGRVPKRALHLVPPPGDKAEICTVCWWNRPDWSEDD